MHQEEEEEVEAPPIVGTRVEVFAEPYAESENKEDCWFGAVVIESSEKHLVTLFDDPNYVSHFEWPQHKSDLRIVRNLDGTPVIMDISSIVVREEADVDDEEYIVAEEEITSTKKKKKKKRSYYKNKGTRGEATRIAWSEQMAALQIQSREISHMVQFFLCQLRAQFAEIVAVKDETVHDRCGPSRRKGYDQFDYELSLYDKSIGMSRQVPGEDLASCQLLMEAFLLGRCARGDKWMPWHTALGVHERYLLQVVYQLPLITTHRERHVMSYAFSGSRDIDLFETILKPLFSKGASDQDRHLGQSIIWNPSQAFARDGILHQRFMQYRATGKKLHTTSYSCHPPQGASGDNFVYYIVDRTRRFVELGHQAFDTIEKHVLSSMDTIDNSVPLACDAETGLSLHQSLQTVLCAAHEIGPTMSKMFLVSTHLAHPNTKILDQTCGVGDGADAAFDFLFQGLRSSPRKSQQHRTDLLIKLHTYLTSDGPPTQDPWQVPRFLHMLRWTAQQTRDRFRLGILPEALSDHITPYDLQVNLCEWRKFRSNIDKTCLLEAGLVLPREVTLAISSSISKSSASSKKRRRREASSPRASSAGIVEEAAAVVTLEAEEESRSSPPSSASAIIVEESEREERTPPLIVVEEERRRSSLSEKVMRLLKSI